MLDLTVIVLIVTVLDCKFFFRAPTPVNVFVRVYVLCRDPSVEIDIDQHRRVCSYPRKKAHKWLSRVRQDRAIFITQDINTNENIDRGRGPKEKLTIQHSDN